MGMMVEEELDWSDLRLTSCETQVCTWLDYFHSAQQSVLTLLDSDSPGLTRALQGIEWSVVMSDEWLNQGFIKTFVKLATGDTGELLWSLARAPHLVISSELQELVDRSANLAHLLSGIWDLRFRLSEPQLPKQTHAALFRWLHNHDLDGVDRQLLEWAHVEDVLAGPADQLDTVLCLLAMAYSSGILEPTLIVFDGLEHMTRVSEVRLTSELDLLLHKVRRWRDFGSCVGLVLLFKSQDG